MTAAPIAAACRAPSPALSAAQTKEATMTTAKATTAVAQLSDLPRNAKGAASIGRAISCGSPSREILKEKYTTEHLRYIS